MARPLTIEVFVDGTAAGTAMADRYRRDLVPQCPDGRCGFSFPVPHHFADGKAHDVAVNVRGTRRPLLNGRFHATLQSPEREAELARRYLRSGTWAATAERSGDTLMLNGFCIAPPGVARAAVFADGRETGITMSEARSEWATPLPEGLAVRTFSGSILFESIRNDVSLSFGAAPDAPFNHMQNLRFPLFEVALPSAEQRKRVAGPDSAASFDLGGYSNAGKLDAIAQRVTGKPMAALGPVLDWGCGCGRIARFIARSGVELSGADIDAENARWCAEHINGSFAAVSPRPPTAFASNTFGAIYGISVFTHLDREHESLWLQELNRIAQPGALILMSIHGGLAAVAAGLAGHVYAPEFAEGFVDIGRCADIETVAADAPYRNVFHQPDYITRVWGRYFDIISIEEGIIGNLQDLVVARKWHA